jgi:hypothetical protein
MTYMYVYILSQLLDTMSLSEMCGTVCIMGETII